MGKQVVFFFISLFALSVHTGVALIDEQLQKSFADVIETAFDQVSIQVEEGKIKRQEKCSVTTKISCTVDATGEDCEDFIVPYSECKTDEDMTFEFEYCSEESTTIQLFGGRTTDVDFKNLPKGTMAYINTDPVDIILQDLSPGQCWKVVETRQVNTCWNMINASLKIEGWRGNANVGDYCYAWEFYRRFFKRYSSNAQPQWSCAIEGDVSCIVNSSGQPCEQLLVPFDNCGNEKMTFTYNYCSKEADIPIMLIEGNTNGNIDFYNLPPGSMAFTNTQSVDLDLSTLQPGECRTLVATRDINTCWKQVDASLKLEGWRGDKRTGNYCFSWDFYRAMVKRPINSCDVYAKVQCHVTSSGQACEDLIVSHESCGNERMTFTYRYCNNELVESIQLREGDLSGDIDMEDLPPGTMAFIHTNPVDINLNDLGPNQCRTIVEVREVNTCWENIDASLKIEGWRGDGNTGDYCYAWDFYRAQIQRPESATSSKCQVSADVSCVITKTGEVCDEIIVPYETCGEEDMTFTFVYCNKEATSSIALRDADTSGQIDFYNLPPGTSAFIHTVSKELDLDDLLPGQCKTIRKTQKVNTCWEKIDASLKVEGWRGEGNRGDYCFAWDFYREYIKRPDTPSLGTDTCDVSSKVSCVVQRTGQPCEELTVPRNECGAETMKFTFRYCNNEMERVALMFGDTSNPENIDMYNLPQGTMAFIYRNPIDIDISDMAPGECRTFVETRNVNTCRETIEASLKIEGWRGAGNSGDYCYAWDFYNTPIKRPDNTNNEKCRVSASIACKHSITNQSCDELDVPLNACGEEQMTFDFTYCNNEPTKDIYLDLGDTSGDIDIENLPPGTMALIHTEPVKITQLYLPPNSCATITKKRLVNTCRPNIFASLKVEGWRGNTNSGDFCFAWKFYQATISSSTDTALCGIPKEEQRMLMNSIIESVSSPTDLQNPNSPQSKARNWILFEDTFDSFCPPPCNRDGTYGGVIQRYTLAVFYFATAGDETWLSCGRNSKQDCIPNLTWFAGDPNQYISGEATWLEPVSECYWGGLSCKMDTECIDRIEFGKVNVILGTIHVITLYNFSPHLQMLS